MKKANTAFFALAAGALLALGAGAAVSAVSEDAPLDTRSLSAVAAAEDEQLDTRSFTVDWSAARRLNTKKIVGTMILVM
jgi:hypothetical protein